MQNRFFKIIFLLVLTAAFFSCSKKEEKIPADVLSPEQMVPLMVDIHIAQSAVSVFQYSDTIRYNNNELTIYILKKRNIAPDKYIRSLKYYSDRPEVMAEIYQHVVDELSKMQGLEEHSK